ncbi:MAG: DUF2442 domain-containing protein [Candidatus Electrothrix sp. EH2]|nr:DUF2442 domain-containing protein [Candidatus Electrothrix sp. EH2]
MNPRVKNVVPNNDYTLKLIFDNGEEKIFDVKPYLDKGIFKELNTMHLFNTVKPFMGSVQWKNGQDFCPDTLYIQSRSPGEVLQSQQTGEQADGTKRQLPKRSCRQKAPSVL